MNEAFHLARLQKIDSQMDQIELRLVEIAKILEDDQEIHLAQEAAQAANQELLKANQELKKLEDAAQAQQIKIELDESALYGGKVRNPKELQDLQNEIASVKRHLSTLEDQQLDAMQVVENADSKNKTAARNLTQAEADFTSRSASFLGERSRLEKDRERLQAERTPIITQLPETNLNVYNQLRRQKRGIAVAGIVEGSCTACGATPSPAEWQAARSPHQIVRCSSCGRILYAG
jgi:uncharacterized protein